MPEWPANGEVNWNAKMNAFVRTEHNADGTHNTTNAYTDVREYTSFALAISGIGSTETTLMIPNAQAVSANITVPANITLWFLNGGSLSVANGVTVTIETQPDAGLFKIFTLTGTGKIVWGSGVYQVFVQWWGAVADSDGSTAGDGTDDLPALDAMEGSMVFGAGVPKMVIPDGFYRLSNVWTLTIAPVNVECGRNTRFIVDDGQNYVVILDLTPSVRRNSWKNLISNAKTFKIVQSLNSVYENIANGPAVTDVPVLELAPDTAEVMYYNTFANISGGPLRFGDGGAGSINENTFSSCFFKSDTVSVFIIDDGLTNAHANIYPNTEFFSGGTYAIEDEFGATSDSRGGNVSIGGYIESGTIKDYFGWHIGGVYDTEPGNVATTNTVATPAYDGGYVAAPGLNNWTSRARHSGRRAGFFPLQMNNLVRDGCGVNGVLHDVSSVFGGYDGNGITTKITTLTDGTIPSISGCAIKTVFSGAQSFAYRLGDDAIKQIAMYGFANISFWVKIDSGDNASTLAFVTSAESITIGTMPADGEWHRYFATAKITTAGFTTVVLAWSGGAGASTMYITDLQVTPGKFCSTYMPHKDDIEGVVARIQTTDATVTTLLAHTIRDNTSLFIEAHILAKETDGSDRNAYIRRILVYRDGGAAVIQGAVEATLTQESDADWDCTIDVDTNDVRLRVTGEAATTIHWEAKIKIVAL